MVDEENLLLPTVEGEDQEMGALCEKRFGGSGRGERWWRRQ